MNLKIRKIFPINDGQMRGFLCPNGRTAPAQSYV